MVRHKRTKNNISTLRIFDWDIPAWVLNSYKYIGIFGFGAACSQLTTDIAKYSIGRLRPHFFSVSIKRFNSIEIKLRMIIIEKRKCVLISKFVSFYCFLIPRFCNWIKMNENKKEIKVPAFSQTRTRRHSFHFIQTR